MFISYRRSPARKSGDDEAHRVRDALRDRGVPTWRDLDDHGPDPTEDEVVQAVNDIGIAGAIMLVSPQVATSPMVRVVEIPAILDRYKERDGFLLKPVLIDLVFSISTRFLVDRVPFKSSAGSTFSTSIGDSSASRCQADCEGRCKATLTGNQSRRSGRTLPSGALQSADARRQRICAPTRCNALFRRALRDRWRLRCN